MPLPHRPFHGRRQGPQAPGHHRTHRVCGPPSLAERWATALGLAQPQVAHRPLGHHPHADALVGCSDAWGHIANDMPPACAPGTGRGSGAYDHAAQTIRAGRHSTRRAYTAINTTTAAASAWTNAPAAAGITEWATLAI